jgi:hypothetical protein
MNKYRGQKAVCPNQECDHPECHDVLGRGQAVAYGNDPDKLMVVHIGCAPPHIRKAYYERARQEAARGR